MDIFKAMDRWDGKSAVDITRIYDKHKSETAFIRQLTRCLSDERHQKAASWLLKHHIEEGGRLSARELTQIARHCQRAEQWETALHLLQLFDGQSYTTAQRQYLEPFARASIRSANKFVRAWGYNLLYYLSLSFAELRQDAEDIITCAMRDEAPSVKARLRNLKA